MERFIPKRQRGTRARPLGDRRPRGLTGWADTAFELREAALCLPTPVSSVPSLSLEPAFRRSDGCLHKALARVDDERVPDLLVARRPAHWPLVFAVEASTTWPPLRRRDQSPAWLLLLRPGELALVAQQHPPPSTTMDGATGDLAATCDTVISEPPSQRKPPPMHRDLPAMKGADFLGAMTTARLDPNQVALPQ